MNERSRIEGAIIRASKAAGIALIMLMAAVLTFRVAAPALWEMGDFGKITATVFCALFLVLFAYGIISCGRILFPPAKEEKIREENSD